MFKLYNNSLLTLVIITIYLMTISFVSATDEADLEIHNTFKPEQCKRKAKVTDILTLHYKGTLQNGEVFDSR